LIPIVNIVFNNPVYLWLFVGVFFGVVTHFLNLGWSRKGGISFANYEIIERVMRRKIIPRSNFQFFLRLISLSFVIFALADLVIWYESEGINSDVVLALDASASMLANDYMQNRLEAAKSIAFDIISGLDPGTRVGIVTFAGTSLITQSLTNDKIDLLDSLKGVEVIRTGGTALGEAVLLSVNLLASFEDQKGRTILLLTDGQNTVGLSIEDALSYAKAYGVIIHTIGIGTEEGGKFADASALSVLDTKTLLMIAESTGGIFYHPQTEEELKVALYTLFHSEKVKIGLPARVYLLLVTVISFIIEWIFINTRYRVMP